MTSRGWKGLSAADLSHEDALDDHDEYYDDDDDRG